MNTKAESHYDDELNLGDLISFLAAYWTTVLAGIAAGLALALAYIFFAPPTYESKLQVEMARTNGSNTNPNANVRGEPIEEGPLLVERLRLPSSYTPAVARACSIDETPIALDKLTRRVTARPVRSVNAVVELTALGTTPEKSKICAESIFEMVRSQQQQLMQPLLQQAKDDIRAMQAWLASNQEFLSSMEKTNIQSAVYLARRDESLWLMNQITLLERSLRQTSETRLVSPIYAEETPVSPRPALSLAAGFFGGLMLGMLGALARSQLIKWREKK